MTRLTDNSETRLPCVFHVGQYVSLLRRAAIS